jgi:heptose I phosphotransferase
MNDAVQWPNGYVAMDRGQLLVHPEYLPTFFARDWRTLDAVMNANVDVVRRVDERDNCRIDLGGRKAYLKRHWERRASSLASPPGRMEADAVGWCLAGGVPTMKVIAAGAGGSARDRKSFFLSEEIPEGVPADEFWDANRDRRVRERLIVALAETARHFHSANLFHRDFYWCHFFVRTSPAGAITAHLIDLQRVLRRPWFGWRWRVKDLGQFWFSAPKDATAEDRETWFDVYFDRRPRNAIQWAALVRAGFYRLKDGRA